MKTKTKIIIITIGVLLVISGIQHIINPNAENSSTNNAPSLEAENNLSSSNLSVSTTEQELTTSISEAETSQSTTEIQTTNEDTLSFEEKYDTEIVVTSKMILDQFISDYKIPLATQLWTIARFDENGALMAITNVTNKSTNTSYEAIIVLTPDMEDDKMVGGTPHFVSVGDTIYGNDGYCDDFFSTLEEIERQMK